MKTHKIIACLLILSVFAFAARRDGTHLNRLSDSPIFAALDWGQGEQPPLKALFFTTRSGARDVVELGLRIPLEKEIFVCHSEKFIARDNHFENALRGCAVAEKKGELRKLLQKSYQVIFLGNVAFSAFPYDVQCQILQMVSEGAGLVCVNQGIPFALAAESVEGMPSFLAAERLPVGFIGEKSKASRLGKGKIITYQVDSEADFLPDYPSDYEWFAKYETAHLFTMRALRWASGQQDMPELCSKVSALAEGKVLLGAVPKGVAVNCRLRGENNQIICQLPMTVGQAQLPELPNGTYYLDFLASDGNVSSQTFSRQSILGAIDISLPAESSKEKTGSMEIAVTWQKGSAAQLGMKAELIGLPEMKVWHRESFPFGSITANSTHFALTLQELSMPVLAAELLLSFQDDSGKTVATARKTLVFPKPDLPDYFQIGWDTPRNPIYSQQSVNALGFTFAVAHPDGEVIPNHILLNDNYIPYVTRIWLRKGAKGEITQPLLRVLSSSDELIQGYSKLGGDHSLARPEVRDLLVKQVRERMQNLPPLKPPLYSLGDENILELDCGYGTSDLQGFRDFVKTKYLSIESLNREWESNYADFAEVPHERAEEALRSGNSAAWNDHLEYLEKMFADAHHLCAAEIRQLDPQACIGLEGTFNGLHIEQIMEKLDWWGPYYHLVENEVLRSLYPKTPRFIWAGYYDEKGAEKFPLVAKFLLLGTANANSMYSINTTDSHCLMGVDYQPGFPGPFVKELQGLRFGLAHLLNNTPFEDSGLLIYWNHLSRRAYEVNPRCARPEAGIGALIRSCYRGGLGFEFVTERTLDRLQHGKVLFLLGISSLRDNEAAAIVDFARQGGTVFADLNPAVLNEYMTARKENPLRELFSNLLLTEENSELTMGAIALDGAEKTLFKAKQTLRNPRLPQMQSRKLGKGQGILLNFHLTYAENSATDDAALSNFLLATLRQHGVSSAFKFDGELDFRVRRGRDFMLLGLHAPDTSLQKRLSPGNISLSETSAVYACGKGFLGKMRSIPVQFTGEQSLYLYSCFASEQAPPQVILPKKASLGEMVVLDCKGIPPGRIINVQVFLPGKDDFSPERSIVFDSSKQTTANLQIAWNDPCGNYRLLVKDVVTGLQNEYLLPVQNDHEK